MRLFKRFPFIMQRDSSKCGIACLVMLCRYYGWNVSYSYVDNFCGGNVVGLSFFQIKKIFESFHFDTKCICLSVNEIQKIGVPCILHWNTNHFVVLYKVVNKYFYIADPAKGLIKYRLSEFTRMWCNANIEHLTGYALVAVPNSAFDNNTSSKSSLKHTLYISHYLKGYVPSFVFIVFTLLISGFLLLLLPFLTQKIVDVGIFDKNIKYILVILAGQFILTMGRISFDFVRKWLLLKISVCVNISLVFDFLIKLVSLPMNFVESRRIGDFLQRMSDHSRLNESLTNNIPNIVYSLIVLIVFTVVLVIYNRTVFLIYCVFSFLYILWMLMFLQKRRFLDYELFDRQSDNNNQTYQFLQGLQEIKLQNCESRRCAEWKKTQEQIYSVQVDSLKIRQAQELGCIIINEVKNMLMTCVTAFAVICNDMTFGGMLAIQYIIGQLNGPIEQLMNFIYSFQDITISMDRISEIHSLQEESAENGKIKTFDKNNLDIDIFNICFSYDKYSGYNILDDITFKVKHGEVTAIVGASGSGKSTLLKILLGYYHPMKGEIQVSGINLKSYDIKWWRNQCGVVMQDGYIFSDSVLMNIAMTEDPIDYNLLNKALEIANVLDFISDLPLGLETQIGNGGIGLSKGQLQRILIARAVYKNPSILFLDEATNSLDTNNEIKICNGLNNFFKNRTVVVIAHRLSTVKSADKIIVLDKGRIVEEGKHEELLRNKGAYYALVYNQLEI